MLSENKKAFVFLFLLLFFIGASSQAFAIGISPADAYVNFIPGNEYIIDYSITSYRPFDFYTEGPFSEFTRIEELSHSDTQGNFRVYLTLPPEYGTPGQHRMYVAAKERVSPGTVNTIAGIRGFIEIDVPFPGFYAEIVVGVSDVNQGEPVFINVQVFNKGKLNISDARLLLEIVSNGKVVKSIESERFGIETTGGYTFSTMIPGRELKPGRYTLRANLVYEGKTKQESVEFRVGTFDVTITNYTSVMYNNTVNPFEIEVESLWNNVIETVYMDLSIMSGTSVLSTAKTPPFDLIPWEKRGTSFYWNTAGIPVGEYDLKIDLHYGKEMRTENRKLYIIDKPAPVVETPLPVSTILLVLIAIILVGFNIYFILGKKKKDKDEEKENKKEKKGE